LYLFRQRSPVLTNYETVRVALEERTYDIQIAHDWLDQLGSDFDAHLGTVEHVACICDASIRESWGQTVGQALARPGRRVDTLAVPSGEASKSVEQLSQIWEWLLHQRADRKTVIVAVGGGVIGDLAGMVAGTYTRGLRFVQVPTTLLSQVDSSVGGKTGINLPAAKNMVGVFWQPSFVAIDTATLATLPPRERISGWAEVVKYGVILDADFFSFLEGKTLEIVANDASTVVAAIRRSCELKAQVVSADERETTGLRAVLNYGHTFGHAIEATSGYGVYLHGEAIAIGMQMAAVLAHRLGRVTQEFVIRQCSLLTAIGLPTTLPADLADIPALLSAMQSDKKVAYGKLRFVLPTKMGHVELVGNIDSQAVIAAIEACVN
jgi:3-dehydroquinate synthase